MASEELPRVLEVSRFATARQTEIQALCSAIQDPANKNAYGAEALPRQLRRRATSHNPYKHKRRPNKKLGSYSEARDAHLLQNEEGLSPVSRPTNRAMRRRPALLQQACESSCCQDVLRATHPESPAPRKLETHIWHAKRMSMFTRWGHVLPEGLVGKGFGSRAFLHALKSGFVMHDSSYSCPIELRGSKQVLLQLLKQVSDLEDITAADDSSWSDGSEHSLMLFHPGCKPHQPIGPITLLTLANSSEDPSNEKQQQQQQQAAVGCNKTLLGLGRAAVPSGSQQLDAAQVSPQQPSPGDEGSQAKSSGEGLKPDSAAGFGPNSSQEEERRGAAAESLVVWVWVHPAAAKEAWVTLKELAQGLGISCTSRVPHLRRIELRGPASDQALCSVLNTVNSDPAGKGFRVSNPNPTADGQDADWVLRHLKETGGVAGQVLPEGLALGLRLADPRLTQTLVKGSAKQALMASDLRHTAVSALYPVQPCPVLLQAASQLWHSQQQQQQQQLLNPSEQNLPAQPIPQQHPPPQETLPQHSSTPQLTLDRPATENSAGLPPLPESRVSMLRQQARLHSLRLTDSMGEEEEETVTDQHKSVEEEGGGKEVHGDIQVPVELRGEYLGVCPIVVVRKGSCRKRPQPCGWSLILPAHWVTLFWQALVYRGAKVAGLREWGWACQQLGIPSFPRDFPDCQAAAELAQLHGAEHGAAQQKQPKGKRKPLQQTSWGLLGQTLPHDSSMKSQHGSAEQQQSAAHSAMKSKAPRDSGNAVGGSVAMPNIEPAVANAGDAEPAVAHAGDSEPAEPAVAHAEDASRDAPVQKDVQCRGFLPAGWWVAHSNASMRRALDAHDSSRSPSAAGTAADTAPMSHDGPQQDAAQPRHVAQGVLQPGLLPSALGSCLVPVRVQMLGKGTAHAAAAILVHHNCSSQQDSPTNPLCNSPLAGGQKKVSGSESQPHSQPEYKPEFESHPPELLRHSQHVSAGDSQTIEGMEATVMLGGLLNQESQQSRQQEGVRAYGHHSRADHDDSVTAKRVRLDTDTDYDVLAMECDDGEHASQHLQSTSSNANGEEDESGKVHGEEEDGSPVDEQVGRTVIGFVTSEALRGLTGEAGARALCSLSALRQLYHQQVEAKVLRNSRHGIVIHVKNCGSSQHWKAALHQTDSMPWHRSLLLPHRRVR